MINLAIVTLKEYNFIVFFLRYLVKFGENYNSGCSIHVSQSEIVEQCDQIRNNIIGILVGIGKEEMQSISKLKSGILNISVHINT